jgi:hypothetical protein
MGVILCSCFDWFQKDKGPINSISNRNKIIINIWFYQKLFVTFTVKYGFFKAWITKIQNVHSFKCYFWRLSNFQIVSLLNSQLISKWIFGVFNFLQKTNKNKSHSSKIEFVCSFLEEMSAWKNHFEFVWPLVSQYSGKYDKMSLIYSDTSTL